MVKKGTIQRSGFVAVMGRPNVGKSTLINSLVGQKIAAVSPRPQTTRTKQLGILTKTDGQIIFVDTPGLHKPHHKLGEFMNKAAEEEITNADLILLIVDGNVFPPHVEDRILGNLLDEMKSHPQVITAINKIDRVPKAILFERRNEYQNLISEAITIPISAARGDNLPDLVDLIFSHLPEGDPFFPEDQITDLYQREIAADLIRASALVHLKKEVPHAIAVRIDEYKERNNQGIYLAATLFVERDSQKGIVIGSKGVMIKKIGITARHEIESMCSSKVYLELRVKVRSNWRNDETSLRRFGYQTIK